MAIGVFAFILVTVAAQSGRDYIFKEFESYGLETLWIYRDYSRDDPSKAIRAGTGITNDIYDRLAKSCCTHVKKFGVKVYPEDWKVKVRHRNNYANTSVEGVDVSNLEINNETLVAGRNFREEDVRKKRAVALIAPDAIKLLFGKQSGNVIGQYVEVGGQSIRIIGVLAKKDRSLLESLGLTVQGYNINNRVLLPYTLYQQQLGFRDIQEVVAQATSFDNAHTAIREIRKFLYRVHSDRYVFHADSMQEWVTTANQILKVISLVGTVSAIAALLVGGVGIYNLMRISVLNRTNEIGLRRAVGASVRDIKQQFLFEATLVGALGGASGVLLALAFAIYAIVWAGVSLGLSWIVFVLAPLVAMAIGALAGYKPAVNAANMSPMEALRYEN